VTDASASEQAICDDGTDGTAFLKVLVTVIRSDDAFGGHETQSDVDLLAPFVLSRGERRPLAVCGAPDRLAARRVEQFYQAVAIVVERKTGLMASSMTSLHQEGFGRAIVIVGKLVAHTKTLRDAHRFGFDQMAALALAGSHAVAQALSVIQQYPDVARA
jgi:probable nitrogen fixation protein